MSRRKSISLDEAATIKGVTQCLRCSRSLPLGQRKTYRLAPEYNGVLCRDCARMYSTRCSSCGVRLWITRLENSRRLFRSTSRGNYICLTCSQSMSECPLCGSFADKLFKRKSRYGAEEYGCGRCLCVTDNGDWGDDPDYLCYHFNQVEEGFFYGMELETDDYSARSDAIQRLHTAQIQHCDEPTFWLKPDGSLAHGIEICFHPRTVSNWVEFLTNGFFSEIKTIIESHGGKAYNTSSAGLHIHREKEGVTELLRNKLILFFSQCKPQLQKIAQRRGNHYCSYDRYNTTRVSQGENIMRGDRNALTLRSYHETIEFRLFRGTLAPKTLVAQIGFADLLLEWLDASKKSYLDSLVRHKGAMWEALMLYAHRSEHVAIQYIHELLTRKRFYTIATAKRDLPHDVTLPDAEALDFDGGTRCVL